MAPRLRLLRPAAAAAAMLPLLAAHAPAQDGSGKLLTFGIAQTLRWTENPDLAIPASGSEFRSETRLTLGFLTETDVQRLSFQASGEIRAGDDDETGGNRSIAADYALQGANGGLTLSASHRVTDVEDLDFLLDEDAAGEPILVGVLGTGQQRRSSLRAGLSFGEQSLISGSFGLGLTDTSYDGATDPDLVESRRTYADLNLRLALNELTDATLRLGRSRLDEEGDDPRNTTTAGLGLSRALPLGSLSVDLVASRTGDDGTRTELTFGHSREFGFATLSAAFGVTFPATGGKAVPTGVLAWQQDLWLGALTARLSHSVTDDSDGDETEVTDLQLGVVQELTPRLGLSLSAGWKTAEVQSAGTRTETGRVELGLNYALTPDWGLTFGATHRTRDQSGTGEASSSGVFVTLARSFDWPL